MDELIQMVTLIPIKENTAKEENQLVLLVINSFML